MRLVIGGLAAAAFCFASPGAAQSVEEAHFKAGETAMSLPIPEHYCMPNAEQASNAAFAANLGGNPTVLTLPSCGVGKSGQDYYLIKWLASIGSVDVTLDRLLGHDFDKSRTPIAVPAAEKEVGAALTARTGTPISMRVAMMPDGRDDVCGYVSGVVTADIGGKALPMTGVACVAVIDKRALEIIRYIPGDVPERIPELKGATRQMALTIYPDAAGAH